MRIKIHDFINHHHSADVQQHASTENDPIAEIPNGVSTHEISRITITTPHIKGLITFGLGLVVLGILLLAAGERLTATHGDNPQAAAPLHPTFALLDANGVPVITSNAPIATMTTCGACHDTAFIASTSTHPDFSTDWNPITYTNAAMSQPLTAADDNGQAAEMNCLMCHTAAPNNAARLTALESGMVEWASTATLLGTGIVEANPDGTYRYQAGAFDEAGIVNNTVIAIQDPLNTSCGQCHGVVHTNGQDPLTADLLRDDAWMTYTTGQVISPQKILNSGVNLINKAALARSWDIHAERVVNCVDCHYAANNPIYYREGTDSQPAHLTFDPRRMDFGEYLHRPLHQFADTARTCESCHDAASTHTWLQYTERHLSAVACETCHIPQTYAPAAQSIDWTVPAVDGVPKREYRGVLDIGDTPATTLIEGYQPVILSLNDANTDANAEGKTKLAPYNLISVWYWVANDPAIPIPLEVVDAAYDLNADHAFSTGELAQDTSAITARLTKLGYSNPRIVAETRVYPLNHNVTASEWAIKDCRTCHSEDSRLAQPIMLASRAPNEVQPTFADGLSANGVFVRDENGSLSFTPSPSAADLYLFGHDSVYYVDWAGILIFLGAAGMALTHGGLRYLATRRTVNRLKPQLKRVYMYSVYERQWHWLQTAVMFGLIFSGFVVHKPDTFAVFNFAWMVSVHNILAAILVINAALAAFYHLVSGEIRQFLPKPYGFFGQAFQQAKYYLRGIFKGEAHPFEKTPERKLNPLQQIVYLGLLNVLLPLQIITGILMWGAQRFPEVTRSLGGLPFLAPFHTLIAWMFIAFVVVHVYLTTTGATPLTDIKAMMTGWDEVETHETHNTPTIESGTD